MEALIDHGEGLLVPERMIVAPTRRHVPSGRRSTRAVRSRAGQTVGMVDGPGTSTPVASPFTGELVGMLVHPGERLREGQPVAWLRVH